MGWKIHDLPLRHQDEARKQLGVGGSMEKHTCQLNGRRPEAAPGEAPNTLDDSSQQPRSARPARPLLEKDLHDEIHYYCGSKGYYVVHSRMDRRSTTAKGVPDFIIAITDGRTLWIECKRKGGKATVEQAATLAHLRKLGHSAFIVENMADFISKL